MINIGIVCDVSWDNYILIHNKFKKFDNDFSRLHLIYNKNLQMFTNCAYNNNLSIIRNSGKDISDCAYNLLKICDIWIIFTNNIEYLTLPQLIINKCNEFSIKYIRINEYDKNNDYYSFETDKSFKKTILKLETCSNKSNVTQFDYTDYNDNFKTIHIELNLTSETIQKLKLKYNDQNIKKKENSIKLLYNKDENKLNKSYIKGSKDWNSITYGTNRMNYYKEKIK